MISLQNVSKKFKLYRRPSDRFVEWLHLGTRHEAFYALRKINLEVTEGRTVGIIGANGAGKSTLLKLITGTLLPTEGTVEISGRIAALLELGTGFHPDFTGRQNIYINGQLLGLTHEELQALEQEIIDFSELGPFIDQPLRTYSSGMVVRLGFSVAASVNPEVLIIDEALSVGDARFAQKCTRRIQDFRSKGTTILFVSHDSSAILSLCDEAVLLEAGQVRSRGVPRDILDEYNALLAAKGSGNVAMRISRPSNDSNESLRRHGTFEALISRLELSTKDGRRTDTFYPGDNLKISLRVNFLSSVGNPSIGFVIKDRLGISIYGTNTILKQVGIGPCQAGEYVDLETHIPLNIGYGDYHLTVAVHDDETHLNACYEWIDNAAVFYIRHKGKPDWTGLLLLDAEMGVERGQFEPHDLSEVLKERYAELPDPLAGDFNDPSPVLSGGDIMGADAHGAYREVTDRISFAFQPRDKYLQIRVAASPGDKRGSINGDVKLTIPGSRQNWFFSLTGKKAQLSVELPDDIIGQLMVFLLSATTDQETLPLRLYEIYTQATPEESKEWPTMTPTK